MTLSERILTVAEQNQDLIAVAEREASFTYRDLFDAVSQLAKLLKARELDAMRPILVFGKNDFRSLAAMLACNLLGQAYVPVDAHTPYERTEMILTASKPAAVIVTSSLADLDAKFADLFANRIEFLTFVSSHSFSFADIDTTKAVSGDDTAYIIYTSGTTGVPKGVAVSHDNLASFTDWMNRDFAHIEHNQFLEQPLYSFDLSIFSLYPSLTTGGTLVSLSRDETTNFKHLFERLNSTEINTWISTPSFVDICLLDPSFTASRHPDLTQFIFCGEELTHKTAEKLLAAFPEAAIFNTYGPTEATGAISSVRLTPEILAKYSRIPLGKAKPGVTLSVTADSHEIIIAGDSVAKGYFENPEKTAAAFFDEAGQAAYHTGDAGYFDEDGLLNYNGRIDFQVKFNGFRIELQDIEANLLSLPQVEKAIVLPKINEQHKVTALIAALVITDSDNKTPDRHYTKALKAQLAPLIMDYMMPTKFVYLPDFPLNQNGKIDRKALESEIL